MTIKIVMLALASCLAMPVSAMANADDDAWIKRCINDNLDEGQSAETLGVYCACMNNKMSTSETLSISAWEKKNPAEQEACSKKAKWRS